MRKSEGSKKGVSASAKTPTTKSNSARTAKSAEKNDSASARRGKGRGTKTISTSDSEEEEEEPKSKKRRTDAPSASTNGKKPAKKTLTALNLEETDDMEIDMGTAEGDGDANNMVVTSKALNFSTAKNWEKYVKNVTTVEKQGNELMVYFETYARKFT